MYCNLHADQSIGIGIVDIVEDCELAEYDREGEGDNDEGFGGEE